MNIIFKNYGELEKCKSHLESLILSLSESYTKECTLMSTVSGIKNSFSVSTIISEIGVDMSIRQLCFWAGLTPQNNEITGKNILFFS